MTKEVYMIHGEVVLVDDEDYDLVNRYKWHCAKRNHTTYAAGSTRGNEGEIILLLMHRLIMNTPKGMQTDHINGNGLDNRKQNLRIASPAENSKNRQVRGKMKGFSFQNSTNSFFAYIYTDSKRINLGYFTSEVAAACAYDYAAKKYHKDFACLNFPTGQPLTEQELENHRALSKSTSRYRGVCLNRRNNKWRVEITLNRRHISVGTFTDEIEAARAYNEAAIKLYGDKAKLNKLP